MRFINLEVRGNTLYTEKARFENDCLFQCIAELFEIDIDMMPHISEGEEWLDDLNKWLLDFNMKAVYHLPITTEDGTFVQSDPAILIWKVDAINYHATLLENDDHYDPDDLNDDILTDLIGYLAFETADIVDQYLAFEFGETDDWPWGKDKGNPNTWPTVNPNNPNPTIYPGVQPNQPGYGGYWQNDNTITVNSDHTDQFQLDPWRAEKEKDLQRIAEEFVFKNYEDNIVDDWTFFNPLDAKREYYSKQEHYKKNVEVEYLPMTNSYLIRYGDGINKTQMQVTAEMLHDWETNPAHQGNASYQALKEIIHEKTQKKQFAKTQEAASPQPNDEEAA